MGDIMNLKEKLSKPSSKGMFLLSGSPVVAEICARQNIDWLIIDCEASPYGTAKNFEMMTALKGSNVSPMIRVPYLERYEIEHALELGAEGVLIPKVDTIEDAKKAVSCIYYPPKGKRGVNPVRCSGYFDDVKDYMKKADSIVSLVQIETPEAVKNLREILSVKELTGVFVGPSDLAVSHGLPMDFSHLEFRKLVEDIIDEAQLHKKAIGVFALDAEMAQFCMDKKVNLLALGNDVKALKAGLASTIGTF
jgi:2-keto-3-deoxy-L-rhamnonate aldolase RhmA